MLKEIHEQPRAVADTFGGRIVENEGSAALPMADIAPDEIKRIRRVSSSVAAPPTTQRSSGPSWSSD